MTSALSRFEHRLASRSLVVAAELAGERCGGREVTIGTRSFAELLMMSLLQVISTNRRVQSDRSLPLIASVWNVQG